MYQRGIIHIVFILLGLVMAAVLIGVFSYPSHFKNQNTTTVQEINYTYEHE